MDWRLRKQIIYSLIVLSILFLFSYLIFLKFKKPTIATCFDNKQNQGEEGIDCGGPCPPCEIESAEPLRIYPIKYLIYKNSIDILGVLENPNKNLAFKRLKYYFEIYDIDNNLRETTTIKETSLDPETKKYLLEINYPKPNFTLGEIKLKIFDPDLEDLEKKQKEEISVVFYNEKIVFEDNKWKIKLNLFNKSLYSQNIEVIGLVYDVNNSLIGFSKTKIFLMPEEVKDVYLYLPELLVKPAGFEIYLQR